MESKFNTLYIHLPFCETKCHYCDFYSLTFDKIPKQEKLRFYDSLGIEAQILNDRLDLSLDSIFMGGGTPSLTDPSQIEHLFQALNICDRISPETEVTQESNPSSITRANLGKLRAMGINRISLGVQSLDNSILKALGRIHNDATALSALDTIFQSGFTNVSADLLCGVPNQSEDLLRRDILKLLTFPLTHISVYLLTLPTTHWLYKELPNEDIQQSHLELIHNVLTENGFDHYEISNFSRSGFRAKHNMNTWKRRSYLGLGPSAHSFDSVKNTRWKNFSSLKKYCDNLGNNHLPIEWTEQLSPAQTSVEDLMLGLRLSDGIAIEMISAEKRSRLSFLLENGMIEEMGSKNIRITPKGFPLSDQIISSLI